MTAPEAAMSAETMAVGEGKSRRVALNVISYGLLTFSMWASYLHWYALVRHDGQPKFDAVFIAGCVDLGVYVATLYRQRDSGIGRRHSWGICTFPNFALVLMICVSVAGNVAEARHSFGGYAVAVIPSGTFLLALALAERDIAETERRRATQRAEARARLEEAERERRQAEETDRRIREAETAERERQAEAERQAEERRQRHFERQAELARRQAAIAGGPSVSVSPGAERLALVPGTGPAASSATDVMRAFWSRERAAGRMPSGADLVRAAGLSETSSLGRQMRAKWAAEEAGTAGTAGTEAVQ
jgi:hypothetical protein